MVANATDVLLALAMARLDQVAFVVTAGLNLRLAPATMLGWAQGGAAAGQRQLHRRVEDDRPVAQGREAVVHTMAGAIEVYQPCTLN